MKKKAPEQKAPPATPPPRTLTPRRFTWQEVAANPGAVGSAALGWREAHQKWEQIRDARRRLEDAEAEDIIRRAAKMSSGPITKAQWLEVAHLSLAEQARLLVRSPRQCKRFRAQWGGPRRRG
jgi:hypothetical protein